MKIRSGNYLTFFMPVLLVISSLDILKAQVNPFFAPGVGGSAAGTGNTALSVTGVGGLSLSSGNSGVNNSGFGAYSLSKNTTGTENTALGAFCLMKNTTGKFNTAAGVTALLSNVSGVNNNSFGWWSMRAITAGNYNCAFGNSTLRYATSGNGNIAIGDSAATNFTSYSYCTFLGKQADATAAGFHNAIAIGYESRVDASNKVVIGNRMVQSIGGWANWTNLSDRRLKTSINKSKLGLDFITKPGYLLLYCRRAKKYFTNRPYCTGSG
jgi:trimeric autotransporter adhesin